jgi:hypothetical protein
LEDGAQAFIDGAPLARRQGAGLFGQEATVEGEKLGDVDDRVAGEAG